MPTVAVVGATGYAGAELVSILQRHPEIDASILTGSSRTETAAADLADLHPRLRGAEALPLSPLDPEAIVGLPRPLRLHARPTCLARECRLRHRGARG
jgi:N-acetyl-gamma-glutamylphosphate reductase